MSSNASSGDRTESPGPNREGDDSPDTGGHRGPARPNRRYPGSIWTRGNFPPSSNAYCSARRRDGAIVNIDGPTLTFTAYSGDGSEVLDEFTLQKWPLCLPAFDARCQLFAQDRSQRCGPLDDLGSGTE